LELIAVDHDDNWSMLCLPTFKTKVFGSEYCTAIQTRIYV